MKWYDPKKTIRWLRPILLDEILRLLLQAGLAFLLYRKEGCSSGPRACVRNQRQQHQQQHEGDWGRDRRGQYVRGGGSRSNGSTCDKTLVRRGVGEVSRMIGSSAPPKYVEKRLSAYIHIQQQSCFRHSIKIVFRDSHASRGTQGTDPTLRQTRQHQTHLQPPCREPRCRA